jgi:hypothetical protein
MSMLDLSYGFMMFIPYLFLKRELLKLAYERDLWWLKLSAFNCSVFIFLSLSDFIF